MTKKRVGSNRRRRVARLEGSRPHTPTVPNVADIVVPEKHAEMGYEYKLGYLDGLTRKKWAWSRSVGTYRHGERRRAYKAGWDAGRKEQSTPLRRQAPKGGK